MCRSGSAATQGCRRLALLTRWAGCLKPLSPLLARARVGLKPPSPLRVRNGCFGAFFGSRGDAGFNAPLLGASRGVVGFNVATLSRQPVLRRSWMQRGALQAGCGGGFALHEALLRRVAGVSEPHVVQFSRGVMPGRFESRAVCCEPSNFARNSPVALSGFELVSLELQRFGALLNVHAIELRATFLGQAPPPPRAPRAHDS